MKRYFIPFFCCVAQICYGQYYGQCKQDKLVNERYFKGVQGKTFVDIGAHNGIKYSNSYFFEKECGWQGICVEPIPKVFAALKRNRNCICVKGCVSDYSGDDQLLLVNAGPSVTTDMLSGLLHKYDPKHLERIKRKVKNTGGSFKLIDVKCYRLNDLLEKHHINHVDFLSIDTEGAEFDIISSIDFSRFTFDVIVLEDNYGDSRFVPFLKDKGFVYIGPIAWDKLFVREEFLENLK